MHRLVLTLALLLPLSAAAAPEAEVKRVRAHLLRIDRAPSRAELAQASGEAEAILQTLAAEAASGGPLRARALAALAHFPSPQTRNTLRAVLRDRRAPELLRSRAMLAMARGFADESISELSAYLSDPTPALQDSAAQALGSIGTPAAKASLRRALRRARDPEQSRRLRKALLTPATR